MKNTVNAAPVTLAGLTLQSLRRFLGLEVAGEFYGIGTLGVNATGTAAYVAAFADAGAQQGAARIDRWLYHPLTQQERRIISSDGSGNHTLHRAVDSTWTSGSTVEMHRFQPSLMHQGINDGLLRCRWEEMITITPTGGQTVYDLSLSMPWLYRPDQILGVYVKDYNNNYGPIDWWDVNYESGVYKLYTNVTFQSASLYVRVKRDGGKLVAETDTTKIPELWARAAARVGFYKLLLQRTSASKEIDRYTRLLQLALADFRQQSRLNVPRDSGRIMTDTPWEGPATHWNG